MDFDRFTASTVVMAVDLVNTLDLEGERLACLDDLRAFLDDHGWHVAAQDLVESDLDPVREGRAGLRTAFEADDRATGAAALNRLVRDAGVVPQLTDHDGQAWHLHFVPLAAPVHARLVGACAAALMLADEPGTRVGVCDAEDCRWAYLDTSRNSSRRHCGESCSTRERVRAHRRRKAAES
jgi:predicted RNA-binding Zn ribbon-like protein